MPTITGTNGGNALYGTAGDDLILGLAGDDFIHGGGGADQIDGGSNNDTIYGEGGDDTVTLFSLAPTPGSDPSLRLGNGTSTVDGGEGRDTLVLADGVQGVGPNARPVGYFFRALTTAPSAINIFTNGDIYPAAVVADVVNFEVLRGSSAFDYFDLSALQTAVEVFGGAGNDAIFSGRAADTLNGGDGDDLIDAGRGDTIHGDAGDDRLQVNSDALGVIPTTIDGGAGRDSFALFLASGAGQMTIDITLNNGAFTFGTLTATSIENITILGPYGSGGPAGLIQVRGDDNDNVISAGYYTAEQVSGAYVSGGGGADMIGIAAHDSTFLGGDGDDVITSTSASTSSLNNEVHGGAGDDRLVSSGRIFGDAGDDFINATHESVVHAGSGADVIFATGEIFGEDGDDQATIDIGSFDAGAGIDMLTARYYGGVSADLDTGEARSRDQPDLVVIHFSSVENIAGEEWDDILYGSAGANLIAGRGGDDQLHGRGGDDILQGDGEEVSFYNGGDDLLDGGDGIDTADYSLLSLTIRVDLRLTGAQDTVGAGHDTLVSIERVIGGGNSDFLIGDDGANVLHGGGNDDWLSGLGGADTLNGGAGTDTADYSEATAAVTVDLRKTGPQQTGGADVDTLLSIESVTGSAFDDLITGDDADNGLTGNAGSDRLVGGLGNDRIDGGAGADRMMGGLGDDIYAVDHLGDLTQEALDEGTDLVEATISIALQANIENARLLGVSAFNLMGNSLRNTLTGNDADNLLSGGGGADVLFGEIGNDALDGGSGADYMAGGAGDDTYGVENVGDSVDEYEFGGTDTVKTNLDGYVLGANVENLTLTGSGNTTATGNDLNNVMIGNGGNNTLLGGKGDDQLYGGAGDDILNSGTGADRMYGGAGNDIYYYGVGDTIIEAADAGIDTVYASVNFTIGSTLENLVLIGDRAINGTGNNLGNRMQGNDQANVFQGGRGNDALYGQGGDDILIGGRDADTLGGGAGADTFRFDVMTDSLVAGADTIIDYSAADGDRLDLSRLDADTATAGDQAFHQVAAFTHHAGELTLSFDAGTNRTTLSLDMNGDGNADMAILFVGNVNSSSGWLL